jgi:hypothetical protein
MVLGDINTIIRLIGNPSPTREQGTLDIEGTRNSADRMVYNITRKADWNTSDYGYDWAVEAANKLAASQLLKQFYDPKNRSDVYKKDFEYAIDTLRRIGFGGEKDSGNPLSHFTVSTYKKRAEEIGPYFSEGYFGSEFAANN